MDRAPLQRKICVLGFAGVGKTTIGIQFCEKVRACVSGGRAQRQARECQHFFMTFSRELTPPPQHFVDKYMPTISNTLHTQITHKGVKYELEIVDSAGQDEHSVWHAQQAIGVDGFILVYSVVNRKSFDVVRVIDDKILDALGTEKVARVLVGNKSDMPGSKKEVTKDEGAAAAQEMGHCAFIECSAKQNDNVEAVFHLLLDEMEKATAPPPGSKPRAAVEQQSTCVVL